MSKRKLPRRKNETVFLGDEIAEYIGTLPLPKVNLLTCWQRVASPHLLQHTDNVVYENRSSKDTKNTTQDSSKQEHKNIILVYVDSPAYAAELSMDKELYRIKMQQETKKEIFDIRFLVSRRTYLRKLKTGNNE